MIALAVYLVSGNPRRARWHRWNETPPARAGGVVLDTQTAASRDRHSEPRSAA